MIEGLIYKEKFINNKEFFLNANGVPRQRRVSLTFRNVIV